MTGGEGTGSFSGMSLWEATAGSRPISGPPKQDIYTDVAVIGGGYTGLSTALHLAERNIPVTVLEQQQIGFGASGRNGGQVNPGIKLDPPDILKHYGDKLGHALIEFSGNAPDALFDLVRRHQIDCSPSQTGWLLTAQHEKTIQSLEKKAMSWQAYGVPIRMLGATQTANLIGSTRYAGALLDPRGGSVHPLNLAQGIAVAAQRAGATIHTGTPVQELVRKNGKWVVRLGEFSVHAGKVVIATNGYTDNLIPKLRKTLVAANSYQVSTEELSDDLLASILPSLNTVTDSRRIVIYYRRYGRRVVLGGRGKFRDPSSQADFAHLKKTLDSIFPQLGSVRLSHYWAGRVAMTMDGLPHLHEPEPGVLVATGYNGRGVALATAVGGALARYIQEGDPATLPLPLVSMQTIPLHGLQRFYVTSTVAAYRLLDKM